MTYDSFAQFMQSAVLPRMRENPHDERLDGQSSGGNRTVFGKFRHNHQVWQVHADTHYEPLLIAYRALASGQTQDPFVEQDATVRRCLNLTEELRHLKTTSHKHLYIYGEGSSI